MIDMILDIVFGILPWLLPTYFLFPGVYKKLFNAIKRIFAKAKELNHNAVIQEETDRRDALLAEMKRLGYDRDASTVEDLDRMYELFKEEFPVLYEDKE
jgi:hypothetical protein